MTMSSEKCFERDLIGDTSEHDDGTSLWLASTVRATVCSRFAVLGGALVIVAALASRTTVVLWALPALFLVVLFAKLLDGRARQSTLHLAHTMPMRLPDPIEFSDGCVRDIMRRLTDARRAIADVIERGPHGPGFDLAAHVAHVPELERGIVVTGQRAEYVARFLADIPDADHREAVTTLKADYETLLAAAKDGLVALESLPARMTLLQLRRMQACHAPSLSDANDAAPFEESLREIEQALAADASSRPSSVDA
jgi:hypothetical protein